MKNIVLSALAIATISSSAYAGCASTTCVGKVTTLYMTAGGTLYVGTDGDESALRCGGAETAGKYMSLKEGDAGKNAMYSLLLTAKTTNKPVTIRIQTDTSDCRVLYVTN